VYSSEYFGCRELEKLNREEERKLIEETQRHEATKKELERGTADLSFLTLHIHSRSCFFSIFLPLSSFLFL
jgi:hypothetical protein